MSNPRVGLGDLVDVTVRVVSSIGLYAEKTMKLRIGAIMKSIEENAWGNEVTNTTYRFEIGGKCFWTRADYNDDGDVEFLVEVN